MSKSLFVGNIAYGAMEMEIRELFSSYGTVQNVRFAMDHRRGRFRGFGFVIMPDNDAEVAVQELDGMEFQGRRLKVSVARASRDASLQSA
ncbi:MAG: RNA recognition motif domain-containing protein [Puniceicoccaceae bacterium]